MSDALLIAVGVTAIAAVLLGVVTWMLVLPARVARGSQDELPAAALPFERVDALLDRSLRGEGTACMELGVSLEELRKAWTAAQARADGADGTDVDASDRTRRIAGVLCRLSDPGEAVEGFDVPPPPLRPDSLRLLPNDRWDEWVAAPALDPHLSALCALLAPEVLTWQANPPRQYGLSRRQRAETLSSPPRVTGLGASAARVLGVSSPLFYVAPEREGRLLHVNLSIAGRLAPALVVGADALALDDVRETLWFMLGRKLTFWRPEHLLCTAVDRAEELRGLHLATAQILAPGTLPEAPDRVLGVEREIALDRLRRHLLDADRAILARRVLRVVESSAPGADPAAQDRWEQWLLGSAETSFRCGLLLSGHLRAAMRVLDQDGIVPGTQRQQAGCYQALYHFYLSEEYRLARRWVSGDDG